MNPRLRTRLAVAIVILAVAIVAAVIYVRRNRTGGAATLTFYGNVDIREARPAFDATGRVTTMRVVEGARVTKGEWIASIDDTRYAARLAEATQRSATLAADLARLKHGSRPEEIARAKAVLDGLRATFANDRAVYERTATLLPQGGASTEERDDARARLRADRAAVEAARQTYVLAVRGPRREDVTAARHAYRAALAATALARREFADTRLYAPVDGVVEDRILESGDMASPAIPVYTIAITGLKWVRAYVPESDLGRVRLGMRATIATDSYPGRRYPGWIGYLSPTAEFTPKTVETPALRTALVYQVRVYVCDPRGELRLGMPATVQLDLGAPGSTAAPGCGPTDAAAH
ncbi:MAG: efflux RND transporter periplasmic adaptor subunit [Gammaproteobacteria bacterium]|nr:efflux RND transporter periplasmic adaptor subunit [Gammaproteobacteria bacterium]